MPDYQNSKIYKIYSVSNKELVYYGSTIEKLSTRLAKHVYEYKNNNSCKSKLVLDAGDYLIELVENYPCANKQQLVRREGVYTKNNVCVNKNIAGRTKKEYHQDNKAYYKEYKKEYYENNKEKAKERKKEYALKNNEKIKEYKEKRAEKGKEKVTCECGCIIRKDGLVEHKKTNKHLELMK